MHNDSGNSTVHTPEEGVDNSDGISNEAKFFKIPFPDMIADSGFAYFLIKRYTVDAHA